MDIVAVHWGMLVSFLGRHSNKKVIAACGLSAVLLRILRDIYRRYRLKQRLKSKQAELAKAIEDVRTKLAELTDPVDELLALTELDLRDLRNKLADGSVTPVKLLHAFQLKTLKLYDEGNSGICEFIRGAEKHALEIMNPDGDNEQVDKKSPLYGIPVSIKESLMISGHDSTLGLIKRCQMPAKRTCVIVDALRSANAIPFVLTATSQAARSIDGRNEIFGDMVNPYKKTHICGGSSSGEAVLLAQRGSPIGIGSDIGGSIRIPAAFCGLASLKPTYGRLSSLGMTSLAKHSVLCFHACPGPMGRKVEDLADVMRTLLTPTMFKMDHSVVPMPFDEAAYEGKDRPLTVGFYDNLSDPELMHTVPVISESVNQAAAAIVKAGHRVTQFEPPNPLKAYRLFLRALFADGGYELRSWLKHEPLCQQLKLLRFTLLLPNWMKSLGDVFLTISGCRPMAVAHTLGGLRSAKDAIDLTTAIMDYRRSFERAWGSLDAVICPVSAYPAPPCSAHPMFISLSIVYSALYNLVDYPAGTVPTGFVDRVDIMEATKAAVNQYLEGEWYQSRVSVLQKDTEGLPIAVQVVGKPYHEEIVLRVMRLIETSLTRTEQQ